MKYLNNGIESNHSPTKNLIETTGGFNMREQAWSTIQDFVGIRVLNKSQIDRWLRVMSRNYKNRRDPPSLTNSSIFLVFMLDMRSSNRHLKNILIFAKSLAVFSDPVVSTLMVGLYPVTKNITPNTKIKPSNYLQSEDKVFSRSYFYIIKISINIIQNFC